MKLSNLSIRAIMPAVLTPLLLSISAFTLAHTVETTATEYYTASAITATQLAFGGFTTPSPSPSGDSCNGCGYGGGTPSPSPSTGGGISGGDTRMESSSPPPPPPSGDSCNGCGYGGGSPNPAPNTGNNPGNPNAAGYTGNSGPSAQQQAQQAATKQDSITLTNKLTTWGNTLSSLGTTFANFVTGTLAPQVDTAPSQSLQESLAAQQKQYNRDRQSTQAEVTQAVNEAAKQATDQALGKLAPKYDVTEASIAAELNKNGPPVYVRPPVTEPFDTPFGYLGEIVDPAALATPKQREAFTKSVLTVVYGLPDNQVQAIVGNLAAESVGTFDPSIVGDKNLVNKAYGIAQERGIRKQSLETFAGTSVEQTTLADQIGHVVAELQGTSPQIDKGAVRVGQTFADNPNMSVPDATKLFVTHFERPRGSNADASASAKDFFQQTLDSRVKSAVAAGQVPSFGSINNAPAQPSDSAGDVKTATPATPAKPGFLSSLVPQSVKDAAASLTKKVSDNSQKIQIYANLPTWAQNLVKGLYLNSGTAPAVDSNAGSSKGSSNPFPTAATTTKSSY